MSAQGLPSTLLAFFSPRQPLTHVVLAPRKTVRPEYTGLFEFLQFFETGPPPPIEPFESPKEKRERKRKEKLEAHQKKLDELIVRYNPLKSDCATKNPYATLFVARISYETSEKKLKKEFECFGSIRKVKIIYDFNNKSRGYAFIEYEKESDLKKAYKQGDGKKIDGRRVLVDVERSRTVPHWVPRRLGGGKGPPRFVESKKKDRLLSSGPYSSTIPSSSNSFANTSQNNHYSSNNRGTWNSSDSRIKTDAHLGYVQHSSYNRKNDPGTSRRSYGRSSYVSIRDPPRSDQRRSDQGRYGKGRYEQGRYDQGRAEQGRSDQGRAEQGRSDQGRAEQGRSDQGRAEQGRSDQARAEQGRSTRVYYEQGHYDQGRTDSVRYDQGRYDQGRYGSGRYGQGRSEAIRHDQAHSDIQERSDLSRSEQGPADQSREGHIMMSSEKHPRESKGYYKTSGVNAFSLIDNSDKKKTSRSKEHEVERERSRSRELQTYGNANNNLYL